MASAAKNSQNGKAPDKTESAARKLRPTAPIVPTLNIPGRSLIVVIAIMTFLACLTAGGVLAVRNAADSWQSDIARELTIQIKPADGADLERETAAAAAAAREVSGVRAVRIMEQDEISGLLAPWLGTGTDLATLPVPNIVVLEVDPVAPPDIDRLRKVIEGRAPNASLDDHQIWQSRLQIMARTLTGAGIVIFALVLSATILSIVFATRGAMAGNKDIVEVLHLVGAKERFIAHQFTKHFLLIGIKGGITGGIAAVLFFALSSWGAAQFIATPAGDQIEAMFGAFGVGLATYLAIAAIVLLVALLTAATSRWAVYKFLTVFG